MIVFLRPEHMMMNLNTSLWQPCAHVLHKPLTRRLIEDNEQHERRSVNRKQTVGALTSNTHTVHGPSWSCILPKHNSYLQL